MPRINRLSAMTWTFGMLGIGACMLAYAGDTQRAADTIEARAQGCSTCHGAHGEGTVDPNFPRIAGKPAGYLFNQLKNFRDGRRSYPPMNYLLAYMNDDFLEELAGYFASQPPQQQKAALPQNSESTAGMHLATRGDDSHGIPACVRCHGETFAGIEPGIPGLIGLNSRYIAAQLVAWRVGTRHAGAPDCMHDIASRLSETQIRSVAAWLGAQSPAAPSGPAPQGAWTPPLTCGSQLKSARGSAEVQEVTDAGLSRGEYLAHVGDCVACHTQLGGVPFAGGFAIPTPFGTLYAPNITPDRTTGIGTWSAAQFYQMLHTGRRRDGTLLYPAMPFPAYTKITRADSNAIFAFLRSLKPVSRVNRESELRFPYDNRSLMYGWRMLYFSEGEFVPTPGQSAEFNRGGYLVQGLGHCASCHSAINAIGGSGDDSAFAGGLIPLQNWYAPSLTSNQESGLGAWSLEEIAAFLKTGTSQRGAVYGPMAEVTHDSLQYLTAADATSMALYLKSLLQLKSVPTTSGESNAVSNATLTLGAGIYKDRCAACHLPDGSGMAPAYPPLASNPSIEMEVSVNPLRMVLNGGYPPQTVENPRPYGMPPFAQVLTDVEVAAVVTYIRVSWGNHGTLVSPREANAMRLAPLLD
jgi:cytochrome c553